MSEKADLFQKSASLQFSVQSGVKELEERAVLVIIDLVHQHAQNRKTVPCHHKSSFFPEPPSAPEEEAAILAEKGKDFSEMKLSISKLHRSQTVFC